MPEQDEVVDSSFEFNGKTYELAPLEMRHLREISKILQNVEAARGGIIAALDRWLPFIKFSVQKNNPDFTDELLDSLTLEQFTELWFKITKVSGVTFTDKGEQKPKVSSSTSVASMDASHQPLATPITQ